MANTEDYKIVTYSPEYLEESAQLLKILWKRTQAERVAYLKWKYHNNPYSDKPLSVVALQNNKVVGFRGYFATPWRIGDNRFKALVVGDTVVDDRHQRKHLSIRMGEKAQSEFLDFKFLLNMESSVPATGSYLKLGFHPFFTKRTSISHRGFSKVGTGDVTVTFQVEPAKMKQIENSSKIVLDQSSEFIRWRYSSNLPYIYTFYYYKEDYATVGRSSYTDIAHILDFSTNDLDSLELIFRAIYHMPEFGTLAIRTLNYDDEVNSLLKHLKFADNNIKNKELCSLLVRPSGKSDWLIEGLDIRDINNWHLRGICSEWC